MTKDLGGRGQALLCIIDGEKMPRGYALHPHPCAAIGSMRLPSCVCVFLGGTGVTRVLLFSEPGCSGEEITLTGGGDLCDLNFPSGTGVKDNVASVYISSSAHQLKVWGTCRQSERLLNPLLLEVVGISGCSDLKYPLCGSVQLLLKEEDAESSP